MDVRVRHQGLPGRPLVGRRADSVAVAEVLSGGAGLELPVGPRVALFGELHATHPSNGEGLGAFNPSFDGWGGLLGINCALANESPAERAPPPETPNPRAGWLEWQLPLGAPDWQLLPVERELSTGNIAGLRLAWNMGESVRDVARRTGWMRVR